VIAPYLEQWRSAEGINCLAAYGLLKKDLRTAFDYIEPVTANVNTFSHRTYELLLRACTEVEALCTQVFDKNGVNLAGRANIIRYSDLSRPMRLHEYEIRCYGFEHPSFRPFAAFVAPDRRQRSPDWYRAYNDAKHNRSTRFACASLGNVIQAVGGVHALLVAQYGPGFDHVMRLAPNGIPTDWPDLFRPKDLPKWPEAEQYSFDWDTLRHDKEPYQKHPLPEIP